MMEESKKKKNCTTEFKILRIKRKSLYEKFFIQGFVRLYLSCEKKGLNYKSDFTKFINSFITLSSVIFVTLVITLTFNSLFFPARSKSQPTDAVTNANHLIKIYHPI